MSEDPAPELTPEEQAVLESLREGAARRRHLLDSGRGKPMANPDKYAFPIGVDEDGRPFEPEPGRRAPAPEQPPSRDSASDS